MWKSEKEVAKEIDNVQNQDYTPVRQVVYTPSEGSSEPGAPAEKEAV